MSDPGQQLHDRATRGDTLSAEEKAHLVEWYALQDRKEADLLLAPAAQGLEALKGQVATALAQLAAVIHRTQTLAAENEIVRHEIRSLQQQLRQKGQPA
jgi:hypothetical protein